MSGSPFKANVGSFTYQCTVGCSAQLLADPLNRFLYYQYIYEKTGLSSLVVDQQSGVLSNASQFTTPTPYPSADPLGHYIYWDWSTSVGGIAVSSTGALTATPGQPYATGGTGAYGPPAITSKYVFLTSYAPSGELVEYSIDQATGTLTRTANTVPLNFGANVAVTPNGKFLYAEQMYMNNGVGEYEIVPILIGASGELTAEPQLAQKTTSNGGPYMWMSPNGNFLYVAESGHLSDFRIDQTTGALSLVQRYSIATAVLAIDPEVQFVYLNPAYASNGIGTTITAYSVNATTGELTAIPNSTVDLKEYPIGLAVISPPAK